MDSIFVNGTASLRGKITLLFTVFSVLWLGFAGTVFAAGDTGARTIIGEKYVPTIWVDPDGCEHWGFDDGWEGYMTPHVTRDGRPVCRTGNTCAILNSDQLFATNQTAISAGNRARLTKFFKDVQAKSFIIAGHTDSQASDEYNMKLSQRRANAVAKVAQAAGADVFDVRGYGERAPKASNRTAAGKAQNRRVEIIVED